MLQIVFRNIKHSEFIKAAVYDKIETTYERFPDLRDSRVRIIVTMENSPTQAGPDEFKVKLVSRGGRYKNLIIEKAAPQFHAALADLTDHLLERLNRFGDKLRMKKLRQARRLQLIS